MNLNAFKGGLAACGTAFLLMACTHDDSLVPFTTDGCSLFPDRYPFSDTSWGHCCVAHDLVYWRGGTEGARLNTDRELKVCVQKASGSALLAGAMYGGVRVAGGPHLPTWFRWGYGWPFGRSYGELSPAEEALASSLERAYRAGNPAPAPPGQK